MPAVSAEVQGGYLVISLPLEKPYESQSGKSMIVGTTNGFKKVEAFINGKKVSVNVTACIPKQ